MKKFIYIVLLAILPACGLQTQHSELNFSKDRKFKIVQFTDIHYQIGTEGSAQALQLMKRILDIEQPDLVVYTGDVVVCRPQKQGWDEVLAVPIERKLSHAVVLGNHDEEHDWTRAQIMDYIAAKPYSFSQKGSDNLSGAGNYVLEIKNNEQKTGALLYFLDSKSYNTVGEQKGYDWLGFDQVDWYRDCSRAFTSANGGYPYPALAFFHIPLHEYTLLTDTTKNYVVKAPPLFGVREEKECCGILNTGMFGAMVESGDVMGMFVGHDHNNDYIGCLNGICMAYGRCTGVKSTYNEIGFGARVIELKDSQRSFKTYIHDEHDKILYEAVYPDSFKN